MVLVLIGLEALGIDFDFVEAAMAGGNSTVLGKGRRDQAGTVDYNFPYHSLSLE